jgi:hypothetical protein
MLHWNPEIRSFVALLCLAVLLIATWNPASSDLLWAVLIPLERVIGFVSSYDDRVLAADHRPLALSLLTVLPARAPPLS